jgi:tetratricopeptide (TPR) repeat protein
LAYGTTLRLIAMLAARRPAASSPSALQMLFKRLGHAREEKEALAMEERIWSVWMAHPNEEAEAVLDRATSDIAARRYDIAETRLVKLIRSCPSYAEAWHKLGTLYYLLGSDDESVKSLHRALEIEPRHFGALASVGEILLAQEDAEGAALAFRSALRLHPHLAAVRERLESILPSFR